MRSKTITLCLLITVFLSSCAPQTSGTTAVPTEMKASETTQPITPTALPTETSTPEPTVTLTSIPTSTPTRAPEVITKENANRLELLASFGHGRSERKAAISPDQKMFAVASTIGVILYDTGTLERIKILETNQTTHSVEFSPDGSKIAISQPNPIILEDKKDRITSIEIWDVNEGKRIQRYENYKSFWDPRKVIFSPDGCQVIDWGETIHDICDDKIIEKSKKDWRTPSTVFSPDGKNALVYQNSSWSLWDVQQEKKIRDVIIRAELEFEWMHVLSGFPTYSPDGKFIASYFSDKTYFTDTIDFKQTQVIKLGVKVKSITISPNSQYIAILDVDNTIHLADINTGEIFEQNVKLPYIPLAITFSNDSRYLSSIDDFSNLFRWTIPDLKIDKEVTEFPFSGNAAFSPDGKLLAILTGGKWSHTQGKNLPSSVAILDSQSYKVLKTIESETDEKFRGVAFSSDGQILALATSPTGKVRFWDISAGRFTDEFEVMPSKKIKENDFIGELSALAFSPDGKSIAAISDSITKRLYVWDILTKKLVKNITLPKYKFNNGSFNILISGISITDDLSYFSVENLTGFKRPDSPQVIVGSTIPFDLKKKEWGEWKNSSEIYPIDGIRLYSNADEFFFNREKTILVQTSDVGIVNLWHIK